MSQPALFLSPSCPCPGTPENPANGFIGGHDCHQRCKCPSAWVEAETETAECWFGGFRQYASPDAPTPPLWYKRSDRVRQIDYDPYSVSLLKQCPHTTDTYPGEPRSSPTCGSGSERHLYSYIGDCVTCTETRSNPGGSRIFTETFTEYGLVDGRPAVVDSGSEAPDPQPSTVVSGCPDSTSPGMVYSLTSFTDVTRTYGDTGDLAPGLRVHTDHVDRYYRDPSSNTGSVLSLRWILWALCPREVLDQITINQWSGTSEVEIHSYDSTQLTAAWTEEEVIAAAPKTPGSVEQAVVGWELRTDDRWRWARSEWSIVARGLVEGVTYEVKPLMRESAWVRDQPYNWSDVDVAWESFTATALDAANGRRIEGPELEPVRGMRTEVTGALIRIVEEGA